MSGFTFLKNSEVRDDFTAPGLREAKEKLDELKMSQEERADYQRYLKRLRDIASEQHTKAADINDLIKDKLEEERVQIARKMIQHGLDNDIIATATGGTRMG